MESSKIEEDKWLKAYIDVTRTVGEIFCEHLKMEKYPKAKLLELILPLYNFVLYQTPKNQENLRPKLPLNISQKAGNREIALQPLEILISHIDQVWKEY